MSLESIGLKVTYRPKIFLVALNTIGHHIRYLRKQNYNMRGDLHTLKCLTFCSK